MHIRRKTEDDNFNGEAYFQADKAFLEGMVAQRKIELNGKYIFLSKVGIQFAVVPQILQQGRLCYDGDFMSYGCC